MKAVYRTFCAGLFLALDTPAQAEIEIVHACYDLEAVNQMSLSYRNPVHNRTVTRALFEYYVQNGRCAIRRDLSQDEIDQWHFSAFAAKADGDIMLVAGWRIRLVGERLIWVFDGEIHIQANPTGTPL